MDSHLQALPLCLFLEILDVLDVSSLGTLRLVSKSFKSLFEPPFLRSCRDRPIDLSKGGLGIMRCLDAVFGIRDLTLTCVLYQFPDSCHPGCSRHYSFSEQFSMPRWRERAEAQERCRQPLDSSIEADKLWMEKRQSEQGDFSGEDMCAMLTAALSEMRGLKTVTLTARVVGPDRRNYRLPEDVRGLHWRELWSRTIQAYRVVMSAIARSQISIEGLYIYRGVKLCGVPANEASLPLERPGEAEGIGIVMRRLKSFAIRLTSLVDPIQNKDIAASAGFHDRFEISRALGREDRELADRGCNPEGIARLLRLMPNLESLGLHFFATPLEKDEVEASYTALLPTMIRDLRLPNLKDLALAGFWATEESTRRIIEDHPGLQVVSLRHHGLTDGSWKPVFSALAQTRALTRLYFLDLHSPGVYMLQEFKDAYMNLDASDAGCSREYFPGLDGVPLWETRDIGLEDLRHGLEFPSSRGRWGMASRESLVWFVYRSVHVGPLPGWD